jgi:hypothetical protein
VPPFLDQIVLATGAVPREGSTWDLIGASWDTIPAATVPVAAQFALLVSVLLTPEEARSGHALEVQLIAPDGTRAGGIPANVAAADPATLEGDEPVRAEVVLVARGVVFPEFGKYELRVLWDGEPLRDPLRVSVAEAPPANPGV